MKTDFAAIDVEWKLHYEDTGPLADWIENDNELTPLMRDYLVKLLRGHLPQKKRGTKRTWQQVSREIDILCVLSFIERTSPRKKGYKVSAMERVAEMYGISIENIKDYKRKQIIMRNLKR